MGKVEANLCFDLFCGRGTMLKTLYADHFKRIVCCDKLKKNLLALPRLPHLTAYQGDNVELAAALCRRHGFPDYLDLDAFGNPDAPLLKMLPWAKDKDRFAIVGTDGTLASRSSFRWVPHCWHPDDTYWSVLSIKKVEYPVVIFRHLTEWAALHGFAVTDFEYHLATPPWQVVYYGALLERVK